MNTYTNTSTKGTTPGYIGLQNHGVGDDVSFRNVRVQELAAATNIFTTIGITRANTRANGQIRGGWTFIGEEMPPSGTVGVAPNDAADDVPVRMPDTTGTVANLAEYRGQTLTLDPADQKNYTKLHFFGTTADGTGTGTYTFKYDDGRGRDRVGHVPGLVRHGHAAGAHRDRPAQRPLHADGRPTARAARSTTSRSTTRRRRASSCRSRCRPTRPRPATRAAT